MIRLGAIGGEQAELELARIAGLARRRLESPRTAELRRERVRAVTVRDYDTSNPYRERPPAGAARMLPGWAVWAAGRRVLAQERQA